MFVQVRLTDIHYSETAIANLLSFAKLGDEYYIYVTQELRT